MSPLCTVVLEYLDKYKDDAAEASLLVECLAQTLLGKRALLHAAVRAACEAGQGMAVATVCAEHADDLRTRIIAEKAAK